jgi:hypothetical protein
MAHNYKLYDATLYVDGENTGIKGMFTMAELWLLPKLDPKWPSREWRLDSAQPTAKVKTI